MKKLKFSLIGQMLLLAKSHLSTGLVFMILFLFTVSMYGPAYNVIFGTCGFLGYFLTIYQSANNAYLDDKKTISPLTPYAAKGFVLPLLLTAFSLVIVLLYKFAWAYGAVSEKAVEMWAVPLQILARLWTVPYHPFLGMDGGKLSLIGYIIIFLTPFIASGLGYFAAYKGFDLNEKIHGIAYEKKNKSDKSEF